MGNCIVSLSEESQPVAKWLSRRSMNSSRERLIIWCTMTLFIWLLAIVPAQANPEPDEGVRDKLIVSDPETRPPGTIEFEAFYLQSQSRHSFSSRGMLQSGDRKESEVFFGSLGIGLTDNLDLAVTSGASNLFELLDPLADNESSSSFRGPRRGGGLVDLELDLRWNFYHNDGLWMSVIGGPTLVNDVVSNPSQNETLQLGQGFIGGDVAFVLRQDWGPSSINFELYSLFPLTQSTEAFSQFGANIGYGYQVMAEIQPVIELNYANLQPASGQPVQSLDITLGLVAQPFDFLQVYAGVQHTLWGQNTEQTTSLIGGFSTKF
jgi:hypothetical protein